MIVHFGQRESNREASNLLAGLGSHWALARGIIILIIFIWSACLTTDHEVAGSIPGTSTNFKCGLSLERGPPSLVRTTG